jgi:hypothetical protein
MKKIKALEDLTINHEEYADLLKYDMIYILKGKKLDDNDLTKIVHDLNHVDWFCKIRQEKDCQPKIQNDWNYPYWVWGYILGVQSKNIYNFEKDVLFQLIRQEYFLEKIDPGPTIEEQLQEEDRKIFNTLFEDI